jgi:ATP synthase protein I
LTERNRPSSQRPSPDDDDFDKRLDAAVRRVKGRDGQDGKNAAMGAGLRIAVELAAAVIVGAGIGIVLDRWLGTSPWFLILFFIVGCAAGFLNVYRTAQELDRQAKERREQARSGDRS